MNNGLTHTVRAVLERAANNDYGEEWTVTIERVVTPAADEA